MSEGYQLPRTIDSCLSSVIFSFHFPFSLSLSLSLSFKEDRYRIAGGSSVAISRSDLEFPRRGVEKACAGNRITRVYVRTAASPAPFPSLPSASSPLSPFLPPPRATTLRHCVVEMSKAEMPFPVSTFDCFCRVAAPWSPGARRRYVLECR